MGSKWRVSGTSGALQDRSPSPDGFKGGVSQSKDGTFLQKRFADVKVKVPKMLIRLKNSFCKTSFEHHVEYRFFLV